MVKDVLELLKFLTLLLEFIDFPLIGVDGLVSLLNDCGLLVDLSLKLLVRLLEPLDFIEVFSLLLHVLLLFLLFF